MRNKGKAGHICREWSGESKLLFSLGGILMSKHCLLKMFLPEETCRRNSTGSACVGNTLRLHLEHLDCVREMREESGKSGLGLPCQEKAFGLN